MTKTGKGPYTAKEFWVNLTYRLACLSMGCNSAICTPTIPCWIWCCSYVTLITQYKIYCVLLFVYCLLVP